jgi:hypothetical protein
LDEFSSSNEDFSASESEYKYNTDVNEANVHGNDSGKADGNWKVYGNSDPDFSKKPHSMAEGFKPRVGKQLSSPLQLL